MKNDENVFDMVEFSQVLSTRICHDLAGPISAVNNGIEYMLDEDDGLQKEIIDMLKMSSTEMLSRLQMFRMAFGRTDENSNSDLSELQEIIESFFSYGKIKISFSSDFNNIFVAKINNKTRQLLVNSVLIVSSHLIYGGTISITAESIKEIIVLGEGENARIKTDDEISSILTGKSPDELTPHNITACLLIKLAKTYSYDINVEENIELMKVNMSQK